MYDQVTTVLNSKKVVSTMVLGEDRFIISKANKILINTAEWLIKKGKLKQYDVPIETGPKNYLINLEAKHKRGNDFYGGKQLSNGLWLEASFDRKEMRENS